MLELVRARTFSYNMAHTVFFLTVLTLAQLSWQASLPSDPTYKAAVVEFAPTQEGTEQERMETDLLKMLSIIESNVTDNLDIIVFPEYVLSYGSLRTYLPDPAAGIVPCDIPDYDYYLVEISCSARSRKVYVVINVLEKYQCDPSKDERCPDEGLYQYNTNVVFDRTGKVVSRYRKTHLYGYEWYSTQVTKEPELATFETDFGVTFGHFICFDMLFFEPAMRLLKEKNITDIIYPTYWYSELPFFVATQLQEGWAYGNDVNLLAAGASVPSEKNTGSGIYIGKLGRVVGGIFQVPTTKAFIADVPKYAFRNEYNMTATVIETPVFETDRLTKISLLRDYNVDIRATKLLDADFTSVQNDVVCHESFCCAFNITRVLLAQSSAHSAYRYRLAAYYGDKTTYQGKDPSEQGVCAVISCTNAELYSCGYIFPDSILVANKYYFSQLDIKGVFPNNVRRLIMPTSVDGKMMPLSVNMYDMEQVQGNNSTNVRISLTSPKADILTFGIFGNYFTMKTTTHNLDVWKPLQRANGTGTPAINQTTSGAQKIYIIEFLILLGYPILAYFL